MFTSSEAYKSYQDLDGKVYKAIIEKLGKKKHTFVNSFEDKSGNELTGISAEDVIVEHGMIDSYPVSELDLEDAMYILDLLESEMKPTKPKKKKK